jgi:ATP-binding cassette subfamily B protein
VHKVERTKPLFARPVWRIHVADPAEGLLTYTPEEFRAGWLGTTGGTDKEGIALLLEPTAKFAESEELAEGSLGFRQLFSYLLVYKKLVVQLLVGLVVGGGLQLMLPFLTQAVVDTGINGQDISFIYLVLLAQLMLFAGRTSIEFIRGWISGLTHQTRGQPHGSFHGRRLGAGSCSHRSTLRFVAVPEDFQDDAAPAATD